MKLSIPDGKILVQFDGMCILCSRTIKLILKADRKKKFLFQTLQQSGEKKSFETIVVTDQDTTYEYFDAVLKIGSELGGIYKIILVFNLIPGKWRYLLYMWIAKNRYKWFGVRKTCYLPTKKEQNMFL